MAGLNPDGLGRNRAYDDLESESHSTGSTDSGEYLLDGAQTQEWKLITRKTDTSAIDVETDLHQEVKVIVRGSGGGTVSMTIDNNTNGDYNYLSVSDTGISPSSGASSWELFPIPDFGSARGEYVVSIRPSEGDRAAISGEAGMFDNSIESLLRGGVNDPSMSVDSVQLSISSGLMNEVEVWGDVQ